MKRYAMVLMLMMAVGVGMQACDSSDAGGGDTADDVGATDTGDVGGTDTSDSGDTLPDTADATQDTGSDGGDGEADSGGKAAIGEPCPDRDCLWLNEPPGAVGCDSCTGNWCYTPSSGATDAYCVRECSSQEDCEDLPGDWWCDGNTCVDRDRI